MANFFENKDVPRVATEKDTPSPASQGITEFKTQMLGQLLGALGQHSPSFAEYAKGAAYPNRYAGMGDVSGLLAAMSQPGAFTSEKNLTATGVNWAPSDFSSLLGLGVGGLGLLNALMPGGALSGAGSAIGSILAPIGGALGIGGVNPALGDTTPNNNSSGNFYGGVGSQAFGSDAGASQQDFLNALSNPQGSGPSLDQLLGDIGGGSLFY